MTKERIHNEWFQPIQKKTCPCGSKRAERIKLGLDASLYAWGEYLSGKWRTVDHFCQECFKDRVVTRLVEHAGPCGCKFALVARTGYSIPAWIAMPEPKGKACKATRKPASKAAIAKMDPASGAPTANDLEKDLEQIRRQEESAAALHVFGVWMAARGPLFGRETVGSA